MDTTNENFSDSDNILNIGFIASSASSLDCSQHSLTLSEISSIPNRNFSLEPEKVR